jgi:prepilin-type N-terminal cleavage/methylation domain-containing protein
MKNFYKKGFTLIELLVVIAIIGLLSSVVLASLNQARAKARDARRISDIHEINNAIQLYLSTNNQVPPGSSVTQNADPAPVYFAGSYLMGGGSWNSTFSTALAPYIKQLPEDPCGSSGCPDGPVRAYIYYGVPGTSRYKIFLYNNFESKSDTTGFNFTNDTNLVQGSASGSL